MNYLKRVQEITQGMGTKWCNHSDDCEGSGFVEESVFFVRHNLILWIVVLCDGKVAFIEFTPEALANFSEMILESPRILLSLINDFSAESLKTILNLNS